MGLRVTRFWSLFCHSCNVWHWTIRFLLSSFLAALFYIFFLAFHLLLLNYGQSFPRAPPGPLHSSVFTLSPGQVLCSQGFYHLLEGSGPALLSVSWTAPLDICNTSKRIYHSLSDQAYSPLPRRWHHYHPLRCQTRSPVLYGPQILFVTKSCPLHPLRVSCLLITASTLVQALLLSPGRLHQPSHWLLGLLSLLHVIWMVYRCDQEGLILEIQV